MWRVAIGAVIGAGLAFAQSTPVILISVDTLRADRLSHAPNIASLGNGGTVFSRIDSQVPLTLPSHWSMMTSTYPFENRIEENGERVPEGAVTLATVLHARGYKTAAFIGSVFLDGRMGFDQGFDFFDSPFQGASERRDGALVLRSARQWLSENRSQPLFAFVHLFDMHKPYPVSYDAQLQYVDRLIGGFKESLEQMGLWNRALVVLVSDHGEGLGDHGEDSHGYFVYESTLHVPVIFHFPVGGPFGAVGHAARVDEPGGLIDVAPTVLDFLQVPKPASFEGTSLLGAGLLGQHRGVFAESVHARDAFGWAALRSFRVGQFKYIEAPKPELYDLQADPGELKNLYVKGSAQAGDLRGQLTKLMAQFTPQSPAATQEISPATRKLLDSLGYLAPGPRGAVSGAAVDPKDRLAEFRLYEAAWLEIYFNRPDAGIAKLRQLLTGDPGNLLARRDLAGAYADKKDYSHAREAYGTVLATAPDDYVAQYGIGVMDERLGLLKEAREHLETACRIEPDSAEARRELDIVSGKTQ